jgi:hypothetical protein
MLIVFVGFFRRIIEEDPYGRGIHIIVLSGSDCPDECHQEDQGYQDTEND